MPCQMMWHKARPPGLPSCFFLLLLHGCHHPYQQLAYKNCGLEHFLSVAWVFFFLTSPDVVLFFQAYNLLFQQCKPQFYQCQGQSFTDLTVLAQRLFIMHVLNILSSNGTHIQPDENCLLGLKSCVQS